MRTIRRTARFKRDYRRESKGPHRATLDQELRALLALLVADVPLPAKYRDHSLKGEWRDHRDCHVKPDLILLYRKPDSETMELVRIGSHSELSL